MSTLKVEQREIKAESVRVTSDTLAVDLLDGRTISVPLAWFPRLFHGTRNERGNWRLIARGEGIHWPDLDEDISVEGLLEGRSSGESQSSLQKWLTTRQSRKVSHRKPSGSALLTSSRKSRRG